MVPQRWSRRLAVPGLEPWSPRIYVLVFCWSVQSHANPLIAESIEILFVIWRHQCDLCRAIFASCLHAFTCFPPVRHSPDPLKCCRHCCVLRRDNEREVREPVFPTYAKSDFSSDASTQSSTTGRQYAVSSIRSSFSTEVIVATGTAVATMRWHAGERGDGSGRW